jgi:hypothetical protein
MTFESNSFSTNPSTSSLDTRNLGAGLAGGTALVDPVSANSIKMSGSKSVSALLDTVGNTMQTAKTISTGQFQESTGQGDWDYYRFNLSEASDIKVALGGLSANADMQILDASGKILSTAAQKGNTAENLNQKLASGNYFVAVYSADGGSTAYSLNLSSSPSDFAGDTASTARQVGIGSLSRDWVGSTDSNDFYTFSLAKQTNLDIYLEGMGANADLQILNQQGQLVVESKKTGSATERIRQDFAAGQYTLKVNSVDSQSTFYNLRVEAGDRVGNNMLQSTTLSPTSSGVQAQDWVGGMDQCDFYKFDVAQSSTVKLDLTGLAANANLEIRDTTGKVIASSKNAGTTAESISQTFEKGTYYAVVLGDNIATTYNLNMTSKAAVPTVPVIPIVPTILPTIAPASSLTISNAAPTIDLLPLSATTLKTNETLKISAGQVTDLNGASDISKVDFKIRMANGTVLDVADATTFTTTGNTSKFDYSLDLTGLKLAAGDYTLMAQAFDRTGAASTTRESQFKVDNSAPTIDRLDLTNTTLKTNETLNITAGQVTDLNGVSDISKVDFKLRTASGTVIDIADATTFTTTGNTSQFGYSLDLTSLKLAAGNYTLIAQALDRTGATSAAVERQFKVDAISPINTDWASLNLKDAGLQQLARTRFADGKIDRQDMIAILKEAEDGGSVDATELADLRTMVAAAGTLKLDDAVKVLANKVVNGDVANQWYTGGAKTSASLGNLFAGSTSGQMEQLINKWFMGGDRPQLDGSVYTYTQGSLFVNGASAADVTQGSLGDCYFLSTLAGMANDKPDTVRDMFSDNGDGTFTVRFFNYGKTDYVTVDRYLATNTSGSLSFAKVGDNASNAGNELWVALAEKAYAQLNESGWSGQDGTNSFKGIEGGWMSGPINQLTNLQTDSNYATKDAAQTWSMKQQDLINMVTSSQIVTAGFVSGDDATLKTFQSKYGIVDNHAYTITSYNAATGQFTVNNPWGTKHASLTWSQLQDLETDFVYSVK